MLACRRGMATGPPQELPIAGIFGPIAGFAARDRPLPCPLDNHGKREMTIEGTWVSEGYGWLLELSGSRYRLHDDCAVYRRLFDEGSRADFENSLDGIRQPRPDRLEFFHAGEITRYRFRREARHGGTAPNAATAPNPDPHLNFAGFCRQVHDHYAFLDLKGVDWREAADRFGREVRSDISDAALFGLFSEMLRLLDDDHVHISTGADLAPATRRSSYRSRVQSTFRVRPWRQQRQVYVDGIQAQIRTLLFPHTAKAAANNMIQWGEIAPGIGYLNVMGEFGYGDSELARRAQDLPRGRIENALFLASERAAAASAFNHAIADLSAMRAVILDLRLNFGGYDRIALDIAGRFADRRRAAFTKQAYSGGRFRRAQRICVEPAGSRFHGPVAVLVSPLTASAGEILVLAMKALPHATIVGESTMGILSDNLYKGLPNGWELSLSNERYLSAKGVLYEHCGIPPDVPAPMFGEADLLAGFRAGIETSISILGSQNP